MRTPNDKRPDPKSEGARIVQKVVPLPEESFADGVEAHRNARRMDPAYGEAYGLGEYIEPDPSNPDSPAANLHGYAVPVAFPLYWRKWFAKQTEIRLGEIDEMVDERLDREAAQRVREATEKQRLVWKRIAWGIFLGTIAGGKYIIEQITWINEQLPMLKTIWHFIFRG